MLFQQFKKNAVIINNFIILQFNYHFNVFLQVTKLLHCYVKSINCEIFQSLTSPLHLPDDPPNYYVSIDLITNTLTSLSRLLFASFGSKKINEIQNEEHCQNYITEQVNSFYNYIIYKIHNPK